MAANQPGQAPPWFRLAFRARPPTAPAPTPAPEPPPPQPRPLLARPAFRQIGQPRPPPTQPQEPAPPQPLPPPAASFETALPPSAAREVVGTASVPGSPILRAPAASLPTSPAQTSSSVPSSPTLKLAPTSSSVPSSPGPRQAPPTSPVAKTAPITSSVPTSPAQKAIVSTVPAPSPRTIMQTAVQTPPQSPKSKPAAPPPSPLTPPPSPLTLPPSQIKSDAEAEPKIPLEAEQKTVVVQQTIGKPNDWTRTKGTDSDRNFAEGRKPTAAHIPRDEPLKEVVKKGAKVHGKKISSDSEEVGMRVITIAGENKGASMEIFRSPKKNAFEGNSYLRNRKENPGSRSSSDEEKNLKTNHKSHKGMAMNPPPMSACMNSNTQGVNNSIVFESSCTHHDPGVHLSLSRKPAAGGFPVKDRGNGHQG